MVKKLTLITNSPASDSDTTPAGLGDDGADLWRRIMTEYAIADVGSLEVLAQICHAQDMIANCRAATNRDGIMIRTKSGGMREHPALRHELNYRSFVVRGLQKLGITLEPMKPIGRPPGYA